MKKVILKICFTIAIVCIAVIALLCIFSIWHLVTNAFVWRTIATLGVIFVASVALTAIIRLYPEAGDSLRM